MRRNSFLTFLKEKSFLIVLTLMLVSAGTLAALFSLGSTEERAKDQVAQEQKVQEKTLLHNGAQTENTLEKAENQLKTTKKASLETKSGVGKELAQNTQNAVLEAELEDQYLEAPEETAAVSAQDVVAEGFSESTLLTLLWPVEGEVILPFSMDRSIYFKTLAQYQYNPAMIISAEEGTEVFASAAGTVTEVGKSNEYGHYVTMDLGDGYLITYGQLFDINAEAGESLEAGARIGMVAYPTRSYIEEGDNLYLRLEKDETPVDPALYLN